jgi:hypothetical protein
LLITNAFALEQDTHTFTTKNDAQRFITLTKEIRCVVCQSQSIADSNASLASDLREKIYALIKEKKSDTEIKNYLVSRYGKFILLNPRLDTTTVFLWAFPALGLLIGLTLLFWRINMQQIPPKKKRILPMIGWREWVSFPELSIINIKAKIDTGARTSALHAFALHPFQQGNQNKIRFDIHPLQHDNNHVITCVADIIDKRLVTDSGGHKEERYVIQTPIAFATGQTWLIEITLTERENMLFRMLLGRSALRRRFIVNPARSFMTTKAVRK